MFSALAAVSLLLCMASAVFWARSYHGVDEMFYDREDFVHSHDGGMLNAEVHYWIATSPGMVTLYGEIAPLSAVWDGPRENQASWHIGFAHDKRLASREFEANGLDASMVRRKCDITFESEFGGSFWLVGVPIWAIAAATAILPFIQFARWRRRKRLRAVGACSKCGYDLSATPNRSPECGTTPTGIPKQNDTVKG